MRTQYMKKCIRYSFFTAFLTFLIVGFLFKDFNIILFSILFLWINNVIFSLENFKRRFIFLIFHGTLFLFLLSRPVISFFEGKVWWVEYGKRHVMFALVALVLSMLGMFIGAWLAEGKEMSVKGPKFCAESRKREKFAESFQNIALVIFWVSAAFFFLAECEKLIFMHGKGYLAYYTDFKSTLPSIVHFVASFMKVGLCAFLATWPSKKKTFIPLVVFLISALPSLIIGLRNPIMLNGLFIFTYYLIRDALEDKEKWIGVFEKSALLIGIPVLIVFMAAYSYIRSGWSMEGRGIGKLFVAFFYGQGVSFDVLAIGHRCIPLLPDNGFKNYTFGGILDYFIHGSIGQKIFGTEALDSGNSVKNALESNSLSHGISYIDKGKDYLGGQGWGSSYILESFADYGYIGIIVFSIILGVLLVYGMTLLKKNELCRIIVLMSLINIYFAPRAEATGWLTFFVTIQFWFAVIFIYVLAGLCSRSYSDIKKVRIKNV